MCSEWSRRARIEVLLFADKTKVRNSPGTTKNGLSVARKNLLTNRQVYVNYS